MKPVLRVSVTERLKLTCAKLLSKCAYNFNLRNCHQAVGYDRIVRLQQPVLSQSGQGLDPSPARRTTASAK